MDGSRDREARSWRSSSRNEATVGWRRPRLPRWGADMAHALDGYVAGWERARPRWQHNGQKGLARLREEALQRFMARGLPTTREEEWRFTSVAPIAERTFALALPSATEVSAGDIARLRLPIASVELVFVNGRHVPALSRVGAVPKGSSVESLADALAARSDQIDARLVRSSSALSRSSAH